MLHLAILVSPSNGSVILGAAVTVYLPPLPPHASSSFVLPLFQATTPPYPPSPGILPPFLTLPFPLLPSSPSLPPPPPHYLLISCLPLPLTPSPLPYLLPVYNISEEIRGTLVRQVGQYLLFCWCFSSRLILVVLLGGRQDRLFVPGPLIGRGVTELSTFHNWQLDLTFWVDCQYI